MSAKSMKAIILFCLMILLIGRSVYAADLPVKFQWDQLSIHQNSDQHVFYKIRTSSNSKRTKRSISNAVIETTRCEHIELMECEDYDSEEMTCMITATGYPCCICNGSLKVHKKRWSLW